MHAFVCFRRGGGEADFDSFGAMSWPPHISGGVGFHMFQGPLGNEKLEAERGKWVEKGEARGKGGVLEITVLTSQFSTGACPAYLC